MALRMIDTQGNIAWHCHNEDCAHHVSKNDPHSLHISHPDVQWIDTHAVELPACTCEGTPRMTVRAHFTERELQPPIVQTGVVDPRIPDLIGITGITYPPGASTNLHTIRFHTERRLVLNAVGELEPVLAAVFDGIIANPVRVRHEELGRQLEAAGKARPAM